MSYIIGKSWEYIVHVSENLLCILGIYIYFNVCLINKTIRHKKVVLSSLTSYYYVWALRIWQDIHSLAFSFLLNPFLGKNEIDVDIEHDDKEHNDEKNKEKDSSGIPLNPDYLVTVT